MHRRGLERSGIREGSPKRRAGLLSTAIVLGLAGTTAAAIAAIWLPEMEGAQVLSPLVLLVSALLAPILLRRGRWLLISILLLCVACQGIILAPYAVGAFPRSSLGAQEFDHNRPHALIAVLGNSSQDAVKFINSVAADLVLVTDRSSETHDHLDVLFSGYPQRIERSGWPGIAMLARSNFRIERISGPTLDSLPIIVAKTKLGSQSYVIVLAHLARPFPFAPAGMQRHEASEIASFIQTIPGPVIVAGDFNSVPWSTTMAELSLDGRLQLQFSAGSWPSWMPLPIRLPLDQILTREAKLVGQLSVGPDLGSDHLPILGVIELTP